MNDADQIVFWGRRSHSETMELIASADFSINYRDVNMMTLAGFSTKIVESVSLGTPVIINRIGDTFDYLEDGISGFALNGDIIKDYKLVRKLCMLSLKRRTELKRNCVMSNPFDLCKYISIMDKFLSAI